MKPHEHLVLVPGMMCDERLWEAQLRALAPLCRSISVADISRSDSITAIAGDVLRESPQCFALAGLSMGGIVALEMWRQMPERITRLALLDTNTSADTVERRESRDALLERVTRGELREVVIDSLKSLYLAEANRNNQEILNTIIEMAMDLGEEVFYRQSRALSGRQDSTGTLGSLNIPTLVLCGKGDTLCPVEFHELIANRIPDSRLVVVENCGHLSTLEQPEQVIRELQAWLRAA